ncbi:MAG: SusD/RagB family nutrient-binding outer membrane lipoprotein [Saprospiraceae bacterium]|nr:SusD/RagB family nutrient-binding outer membrane lipoprotein [Saprospiraceae bacterium]
MKNLIINYSVILLMLLFTASCDKGFDELNTNEVDPTSIDPAFILNNASLGLSHPGGSLVYDIGIVQYIVSPNSGVLTGANFNQDNRNSTEGMWVDYYRTVIKHTRDVIARTEDLPERNNLRQMARIVQAYAFMVLTDAYGDIPYLEGGKGFTDQLVLPKYDTQQSIYPDLIKELREAVSSLTAGGKSETSEVFYGGDLEKWKRLGNSLLVRAGMRLSKVDPAQAQQIVSAAAAGIMQSNADNWVIKHDNNYRNGYGATLNGTEANNYYLVSSFVDFLKNSNDPRLSAIALRYVGAKSGPEQKVDIASREASVQVGMPMGHDNNSIQGVASNLGLASFYDFSQADRSRVCKVDAPLFLVTYAQTQLLLAEAAMRGWVSGAADTYYMNGVRAHMEQMADFDARSEIAAEDVDAYLAANPFDGGNGMQQINDQYWVASFLNGPEAWANFRRSGYPQLAPNPFPSQDLSGEQFIRRMTYPSAELGVNTANVNEAIARQGPDILDTRVWWDKK